MVEDNIGKWHIAELELLVSTYNKLLKADITEIWEFQRMPPVVLMVRGNITLKECLEIYSKLEHITQQRQSAPLVSQRIDIGLSHRFELFDFRD